MHFASKQLASLWLCFIFTENVPQPLWLPLDYSDRFQLEILAALSEQGRMVASVSESLVVLSVQICFGVRLLKGPPVCGHLVGFSVVEITLNSTLLHPIKKHILTHFILV